MILLHIIGGLVRLTSGAVALSARKGASLHGKADKFPEALRSIPLLCTPVLLVLLLMVYWLTRVLFTQWHPNY